MQIAIDVEDSAVAHKILDYLKKFKEKVNVQTLDSSGELNTYLKSEQFRKDRDSLHDTLDNIKSGKTPLSKIDDTFWDDMDKVIDSA